MPRKVLDQEMQELHAQIMHTGSVVEETLAKALVSLETGDQTALHELVTVGTDLNRLSAAIEKQAIRLLILQQPLGGKDLRYLTAALLSLASLNRQAMRSWRSHALCYRCRPGRSIGFVM